MKRLRSHPSAHVVYGWLSLAYGGKGDRAYPKGFNTGEVEGGFAPKGASLEYGAIR